MTIGDPKSEPFVLPRACDILAARLREAIVDGTLAPGDALPPARRLGENSGLSRSAVRDALRILEAECLVLIKPGRGGGAFVRELGQETISRSLDVLVRGQRLSVEDLLAVREGIEPQAAYQAAVNATEADIAEIDRETCRSQEQLDDWLGFQRANLAWHMAVVRASHNPLFVAIMTSISSVLHGATDAENFSGAPIRRLVAHAHRCVFEAIRARDPAAAKRRMDQHLGDYAGMLVASHTS